MKIEQTEINNPNAFPTMEHGYDRTGSPIVSTYEGMSLRDYFANSVLNGIQANISCNKWSMGKQVKYCYDIADEMLKQREL